MHPSHTEGLAALKAGDIAKAVEQLRGACAAEPHDAEAWHDLGLALLSSGDAGLAAWAQRRALAVDPEHLGARAQLAGLLEAIGDDAGAAEALDALLASSGPNVVLSARREALRAAAAAARARRLVGSAVARVATSPLIGSAFARAVRPNVWRAAFAELTADVASGTVARLTLMFDDLDASMARTDLSYGGTTEDEHGRRVPLDEFQAAAIVFLSEALGIDTVRARRLLRFLLTPECGLGPVPVAGCNVGWSVEGANGHRRYGLVAGS